MKTLSAAHDCVPSHGRKNRGHPSPSGPRQGRLRIAMRTGRRGWAYVRYQFVGSQVKSCAEVRKEHVCVICPKRSAVAQIDSSASQYRHDRGPAAPDDGTESKVVRGSEVVRARDGPLREWWQRFDVAGEPPCHISIGNHLVDLRNHKQPWIPGDVNGNDGVIRSKRDRSRGLRATNHEDDSKANPRCGEADEN